MKQFILSLLGKGEEKKCDCIVRVENLEGQVKSFYRRLDTVEQWQAHIKNVLAIVEDKCLNNVYMQNLYKHQELLSSELRDYGVKHKEFKELLNEFKRAEYRVRKAITKANQSAQKIEFKSEELGK